MRDAASVLRQQILALGATLVGFADIEGLLQGDFAQWPRAVSIGLALPDEVIDPVAGGPTLEYFDTYNRANERLNDIAGQTVGLIHALGHQAEGFPATVQEGGLDERNLRVAFQHKTAATRAGLGWVGKSALLISYACGPRVRFATAFTDMPLQVGTPVGVSECRRCTACVRACPAGAISGEDWWAGRPREDLLDASSCHAEARRRLIQRVGVDKPVCGICIAVCPKGRPKSARRGRQPLSLPADETTSLRPGSSG